MTLRCSRKPFLFVLVSVRTFSTPRFIYKYQELTDFTNKCSTPLAPSSNILIILLTVKKVQQNTYHFLDWALFLFTGVKCVVVVMKQLYCHVKKTSGRMEHVLKKWLLLSRVALHWVKKKPQHLVFTLFKWK